MGLLDAVGGMGGLLKLVTNPAEVVNTVSRVMPGTIHTLGRLRLVQEISTRSALLAGQLHNALTMVATAQRDITQAEADGINAHLLQLIQVAIRLNKYPVKIEEMTLAKLAEVYEIGPAALGAPGAGKEAGDQGNKGNSAVVPGSP